MRQQARAVRAARRAARILVVYAEEVAPDRVHDLVRRHLATFVEHTAAIYTAPLPRYVVDAFERYLTCGDSSRGFLRCRCDGCGHDVLVAFSCKHRGLCPSCGARRMANEAGHHGPRPAERARRHRAASADVCARQAISRENP